MKNFISLDNQYDLIKLAVFYLDYFGFFSQEKKGKERYVGPLVISYLVDTSHRPGTLPDDGETETALKVAVTWD